MFFDNVLLTIDMFMLHCNYLACHPIKSSQVIRPGQTNAKPSVVDFKSLPLVSSLITPLSMRISENAFMGFIHSWPFDLECATAGALKPKQHDCGPCTIKMS